MLTGVPTGVFAGAGAAATKDAATPRRAAAEALECILEVIQELELNRDADERLGSACRREDWMLLMLLPFSGNGLTLYCRGELHADRAWAGM